MSIGSTKCARQSGELATLPAVICAEAKEDADLRHDDEPAAVRDVVKRVLRHVHERSLAEHMQDPSGTVHAAEHADVDLLHVLPWVEMVAVRLTGES